MYIQKYVLYKVKMYIKLLMCVYMTFALFFSEFTNWLMKDFRILGCVVQSKCPARFAANTLRAASVTFWHIQG